MCICIVSVDSGFIELEVCGKQMYVKLTNSVGTFDKIETGV